MAIIEKIFVKTMKTFFVPLACLNIDKAIIPITIGPTIIEKPKKMCNGVLIFKLRSVMFVRCLRPHHP